MSKFLISISRIDLRKTEENHNYFRIIAYQISVRENYKSRSIRVEEIFASKLQGLDLNIDQIESCKLFLGVELFESKKQWREKDII